MTKFHSMPLDDHFADMADIREREGYIGCFPISEVPGGIPNGTRIVKINSEPGDTTPDGSLGTILGGIKTPDGMPEPWKSVYAMYWVEWDHRPKAAVGIVSTKITKAE